MPGSARVAPHTGKSDNVVCLNGTSFVEFKTAAAEALGLPPDTAQFVDCTVLLRALVAARHVAAHNRGSVVVCHRTSPTARRTRGPVAERRESLVVHQRFSFDETLPEDKGPSWTRSADGSGARTFARHGENSACITKPVITTSFNICEIEAAQGSSKSQ